MISRQPPTRVLWAAGAAVSFILLLIFFHDSAPGLNQLGGGRSAGLRGVGKHGSITRNDIFNNTLGFEKVFVIGLPERTNRRDGMALAAAASNLQIDFIDGVKGQDVPDKAIPIEKGGKRIGNASIGSWRAHMNAVQEIVHRNLTSALILEDDTDWDIRIRQQLYEFALSAHALIQPLAHPSKQSRYADPTYNLPPGTEMPPNLLPEFKFTHLPSTIPPTRTPYGDDWDLLWLGHCGMSFPLDRENHTPLPKGRVIHLDDITVPPKGNLWSLNKPFTLTKDYPPHTSAVHHAREGVCSLGYALSQRGAQKLLYEVGTKPVTDGFDILLRFFCEGGKGRKAHNCLAAQPGYFQHHRAVGPLSAASDIGNHGDGYREKAMTDMIRWSVRLNLEALMEGGGQVVDQFPDKKEEEKVG